MIFSYLDYKKFASDEFEKRSLSLKEACEVTGIQPPYMTKVLKHSAHFTELQIFRLSQLFSLSEDEENYFELLVSYGRASDKDHRAKLKDKILRMRERKQVINSNERKILPRTNSESMKLIEFHLSPNQQMIYLAMKIPKYRNHPYSLCQQLEILESEVDDTLIRLERLGLIVKRGMHYFPVDSIPTLEDGHALLAHHHRNWRIEAMKRYFPKSPENLKVTTSFCGNLELQAEFKKRLLKLVKTFELEAENSASSSLFQLNIDLFSVC